MLHEDVVHEVPVVDVADVHGDVDVDAVTTSRGFYVLATHTHPRKHKLRVLVLFIVVALASSSL